MSLAIYIAPERQELLESNQLSAFDEVWQHSGGWFEAPNERRGGWSGVCRLALSLPKGDELGIFLKRQENHQRRTFRHPLSGEPTFSCEFKMMRYLHAHAVPTPMPIFFGQKVVDGKARAILMTEELVGFEPLETLTKTIFANGSPSLATQRSIVRGVVATVRKLHNARIQHRSLYPKHLFVRLHEHGDPDVVVIDLEKSRTKLISTLRTYYDLTTLNRHAKHWSKSSRLYFFKQYLGIKKLTPWTKFLCRQIIRRTRRRD